eukprot:9055890-Pyramimonas_sp.AAC.1
MSSFLVLPGHYSSHALTYDMPIRVVFQVYWRSSISRNCASHAVRRFSGRALLLSPSSREGNEVDRMSIST